MKHILIVITKMYAGEGDLPDEFVERWGGKTDNAKKWLMFYQTDPEHEYVLLVIRGGDFDTDVPDAAGSAREGIQACLKETYHASGDALKAVMFHPPSGWINEDRQTFAKLLKDSDLDLLFVKEYKGVTESIKVLAEKCRSGAKFTGDFAAICREQRAENLRQLFADLTYLINPLTVLANDLESSDLDDASDCESILEQFSDPRWLAEAHQAADADHFSKLLAETAAVARRDCDDADISRLIAEVEERLTQVFQEGDSAGQVQALLKDFEDDEAKEIRIKNLTDHSKDFKDWYKRVKTEVKNFEELFGKAVQHVTLKN